MTLEITLVIGGTEVTRKVEIPKGDIVAFVQPPRMQGQPKEKLEDYAQRILNAQGEASNAKAKVIADAINAKFKDDFAKLPAGQAAAAMASAGFTIVKNRSIIVPATRGSVKEGIRADGVPRRRRERPRQEHRVASAGIAWCYHRGNGFRPVRRGIGRGIRHRKHLRRPLPPSGALILLALLALLATTYPAPPSARRRRPVTPDRPVHAGTAPAIAV